MPATPPRGGRAPSLRRATIFALALTARRGVMRSTWPAPPPPPHREPQPPLQRQPAPGGGGGGGGGGGPAPSRAAPAAFYVGFMKSEEPLYCMFKHP